MVRKTSKRTSVNRQPPKNITYEQLKKLYDNKEIQAIIKEKGWDRRLGSWGPPWPSVFFTEITINQK